tara:strand:+ start:996 stop:2039 length:1044 start_codon:yes stop_codon:yes gene_type:complete
MQKRSAASLFSLLLLAVAFSGCIAGGDGDSVDAADDSEIDEPIPYFQDGIYNCLEHENLTRCWQTHIPDNLDLNESVPLIIDLHGYASSSTEQKALSSFNTIADEEGAIVIYPDGVLGKNGPWDLQDNQAWNSGWCCAHSARDDVDDVGFIEKIVTIALDIHNVDANRIYASGWSNGCSMAQKLAMDSSHIFAAVGCMAFYLLTEPVEYYSPIPVMEVHGLLDTNVNYQSSVLSVPFNEDGWTDPEAYETGAIENMYEWGDHNGCSGPVETFELNGLYSIQGFDDCQNGTSVRLMTIYAAQHNPYANDFEDGTLLGNIFVGTQGLVESSHIVWEFLSQFSKELEPEE